MTTAQHNTSDSQQLQRAKRLPAPTPGLVVTVPLALYPVYMALHQIEPVRYRHPVVLVKKLEV